MSWSSAVSDLRSLLNDNSTDRYRYRKKVFGELNGTNTAFKTLENRRVTDLSATAGVWKNGVLLSIASIASDVPLTGEFVLVTAPVDGDVLEASYYYQYFLDAELTVFLTSGADWLGFAGDYTNLDPGLRPSCKHYAAAEGYLRLASRMTEAWTDTYRLEDAPNNERTNLIKMWMDAAEMHRDMARKLRDDYYTRQGQSLSPNWEFVQFGCN